MEGEGGVEVVGGNDITDLDRPTQLLSSVDIIIPKESSAGFLLLFSSLLEGYTQLLEQSPYPTKMITSAIIGALGDYIIQSYESRITKKALDFRRIIVFGTVCGLYVAPVIHNWFNFLNSMPFLVNMSNLPKALAMMLVDQSIGATAISFGFFFAFEAAQSLFPPYASPRKNFLLAGWSSAKRNIGVTMVANWKIWPVVNYINFLLIPLEYRVLFANFASVFWNMFLSQIANKEESKAPSL